MLKNVLFSAIGFDLINMENKIFIEKSMFELI